MFTIQLHAFTLQQLTQMQNIGQRALVLISQQLCRHLIVVEVASQRGVDAIALPLSLVLFELL